jgi:hypothetical protein
MHMVLVWGIILLASGFGYLASPRFVRWTLDHDRTGQRWARWLGTERAPTVLRFVFGPILIVGGILLTVLGLGWI